MSWSLFKANIIRKTSGLDVAVNTIDNVAKIWANEYDACIKRGKDFINLESVKSGNKTLMETFFKLALIKGTFSTPSSNFQLVNEFGTGVRMYWVGAQMNPFPIPLIPAPGSIQNISVSNNVCIKSGTWPEYPPIFATSNQELMIDQFILAAIIHLFTIGGIIQTTSLYPSAPTPVPAPGIIQWNGYLIPPVIPIPNINFPSEDGLEPPVIQQPDGSNSSGLFPPSVGDIPQPTQPQFDEQPTLNQIIDESLPPEVRDAINVDEIVPDFKEQIRLGGTKCD